MRVSSSNSTQPMRRGPCVFSLTATSRASTSASAGAGLRSCASPGPLGSPLLRRTELDRDGHTERHAHRPRPGRLCVCEAESGAGVDQIRDFPGRELRSPPLFWLLAELWPTEACLPAGQGGGKIPKDISDERERRRAHDAGFEDLTKRSITRGTSYTTGHLTAIGSTGRVLCMIINGVVAGAP